MARAASIAGADPEPIIDTTGSLPLTALQAPGEFRVGAFRYAYARGTTSSRIAYAGGRLRYDRRMLSRPGLAIRAVAISPSNARRQRGLERGGDDEHLGVWPAPDHLVWPIRPSAVNS